MKSVLWNITHFDNFTKILNEFIYNNLRRYVPVSGFPAGRVATPTGRGTPTPVAEAGLLGVLESDPTTQIPAPIQILEKGNTKGSRKK